MARDSFRLPRLPNPRPPFRAREFLREYLRAPLMLPVLLLAAAVLCFLLWQSCE